MNRLRILPLAFVIAGTAFAQVPTPPTAYQKELERLQAERDRLIQAATDPILQKYRLALEQLQRKATQAGDLDSAVQIRAELEETSTPMEVAARLTNKTTAHPLPKGTVEGSFGVSDADAPKDVFAGKSMYFDVTKGGRDIFFRIQSPKPLTKVTYTGVAFDRFTLSVVDPGGRVLAASPRTEGGNQEQKVEVPIPNLKSFTLAIHNEASNWMLIKSIVLE